MGMPLGRGGGGGGHFQTSQQDFMCNSNNQQRTGSRHWSEGEYSDEMNSNMSGGHTYGGCEQPPIEPTDFDAASSKKGMVNSDEGRADR